LPTRIEKEDLPFELQPKDGQEVLCCRHLREKFKGGSITSFSGEANVVISEEGIPMEEINSGKKSVFTHLIMCDECVTDPAKAIQSGNMFPANFGILH
jgi:hypothetical protein